MLKNTLKQIIGRSSIIIINQISILIVLPLLAFRLDLEMFGQIAIGLVLIQMSWMISDWGIQNYSIEKWPNQKTLNQKNEFISVVTSLRLLVSVFCLLIIYPMVNLGFIDFPMKFFFCIIPSVIMGGSYPLWFYQVQKSPHEMILVTFYTRNLYLLIIFILVKGNTSAFWVFLAQGINMTIITIYAFFKIYAKYNFCLKSFKYKSLLLIFKQSWPFLINAIANNQINTLWGFGLAIFGGPGSMAIFNLADQIYRAGGALSNIISQAVRINFYGAVFSKIKSTIILFSSLFLFLSLGLSSSAELIIKNFFPQDYYPAVHVIQVMIFAWGMHAIIKLLNYPVLGESYGSVWVNRITYLFLVIHAMSFFVWAMYFRSPLSLSLFFSLAILFQLIIYLWHISKLNLKDVSNKL
jgi:O-antigen/teichoic acid export membrane protein